MYLYNINKSYFKIISIYLILEVYFKAIHTIREEEELNHQYFNVKYS